jgi:hypothetical protein
MIGSDNLPAPNQLLGAGFVHTPLFLYALKETQNHVL